MTIFVVCGVADKAALASALQRKFKDDHLKIDGDVWLVSASGTTQQVAEKIGAVDGDAGDAIVFRTTSYYGMADPEIWEWMALKLEKGSG